MDQVQVTTPWAPGPWWRRVAGLPDHSRATAVLFPHAGGSAHGFMHWAAALPSEWVSYAYEYPGHGSRFQEELPHRPDLLIEAIVEALAGIEEPLILGGHSLGALVAHALAERLTSAGRMPAGLLVSAAVPPTLPLPPPDTEGLSDRKLAELLVARGDVPAEIAADHEALDLFLPPVRAGFRLAQRMRRSDELSPVATTGLVVGGRDDDRVPVTALPVWREAIAGDCDVVVLSAGHFYPEAALAELEPAFATFASRCQVPAGADTP